MAFDVENSLGIFSCCRDDSSKCEHFEAYVEIYFYNFSNILNILY